MSDSNAAIARRYYSEILNAGNSAAIDQLIAADFVLTSPTYPQPTPGPEGFKQYVAQLRHAFPDLYYNLETLVAEGDTVAAHWTVQGHHQGTIATVLGEIPASGQAIKVSGVSWFTIAHNQIHAVTSDDDAMGFLMQLGVIPTGEAPVTTTPQPDLNKAIVQRYFSEIMSQGNLAVVDELMSDNFLIKISSLHEPFRGRDGMKQFVTGLRTAFPDITFTVESLVAAGETVVARFSSLSTHKADFAGIPATNKQVKDQGTDVFQIVDGKIAQILVNENALGLMQQLGVIPQP